MASEGCKEWRKDLRTIWDGRNLRGMETLYGIEKPVGAVLFCPEDFHTNRSNSIVCLGLEGQVEVIP
jgi:hypothetical protein